MEVYILHTIPPSRFKHMTSMEKTRSYTPYTSPLPGQNCSIQYLHFTVIPANIASVNNMLSITAFSLHICFSLGKIWICLFLEVPRAPLKLEHMLSQLNWIANNIVGSAPEILQLNNRRHIEMGHNIPTSLYCSMSKHYFSLRTTRRLLFSTMNQKPKVFFRP
jgi:hypothetical protein